MALTLTQERFADAILDAPSAAEAARRAGYSQTPGIAKRKAWVALGDPEVQAAIAARRAERQALARAHAALTIPQLMAELHALAVQAADHGDFKAAAKCLELYGRHLGAWGEGGMTINVAVLQQFASTLRELPDAALDAIGPPAGVG